MSDMLPNQLPLFPLNTVLVPGASLGLRIFEARYLDLVRDCARSGTGFGVCLILDGGEAGQPATPAMIGTEARIEDFGATPEGLLTISARGGRRFRVRESHVRGNGLRVAEVEWCEPDPDDELRPEHALLGTLLHQVVEQVGGEYAKAPPSRFDDAAWVSWRLAELLPLDNPQRLGLLEEDDPHARLDRVLTWMP
ncbi:MAG: LON peptidase substrate-binding domain-containing protein [Pseudomonadota bacterium]|jgi:uncharacterized protein